MKVTRDMVDKDLRGSYAVGRIIASFFHTRWFSLLVFRLSGAVLRGKPIRGLVCQERHIPSRSGGSPIRVRIYRPTAAVGPLPVMLYLHGGGYLRGVPEQFGSSIKDFIETAPCIIVAPDYRKAVESPYPAAFNDCYDTLLWIRDNAASLGGRTDGFIVSGHSAGGGLAAAVSLRAADTGDAKIAFQIPSGPGHGSWRTRWFGWLEPVMQPRFAMGMAMTGVCFMGVLHEAKRNVRTSTDERASMVGNLANVMGKF